MRTESHEAFQSRSAAQRHNEGPEHRTIERRVLCVREAAQYLGRSERSVRHLVERKRLRCIRSDGRVMFDRVDFESWIEMNRL
jgi:excisionase family DNA binding protein